MGICAGRLGSAKFSRQHVLHKPFSMEASNLENVYLECIACGNSWYASRDEVSMLLIDTPNSAKSVGTAPWATAKFDEVEKKLVSPCESDKATEFLKKTSEPYMPVLENQRSFSKVKIEESSETQKNAE